MKQKGSRIYEKKRIVEKACIMYDGRKPWAVGSGMRQ